MSRRNVVRSNNPTEGRERIIRAAFGLFAERGYYGVSISDVAESAGLVKSSIYHHFESKEALYVAVLSETCDALRDEMQASARGRNWKVRLRSTVLTLARSLGPHSHSLGLILEGITHTPSNAKRSTKAIAELRQNLFSVLVREIANGIAAGDLEPTDSTMTAACLIGLIVSVLQADQNQSEDKRVNFAFNLFLQGALRRKK